nr:glycosyltransferase family 1 protein [Derxia lacustris]
MNILLVTDAWAPQVNGVVRTWTEVLREARALGLRIEVAAPDAGPTMAAPTEPGVRLSLAPVRVLDAALARLPGRRPDALHIATEGPLGLAARLRAGREGWRFTTSYHTRFPEYLAARLGLPEALGHAALRWFHRPARRVLVPTARLRDELAARDFRHLRLWSRGVDGAAFRPEAPPDEVAPPGFEGLPRPIFLSVGRVAREKNLEAFLALDLPGSKVVVGGGPELARLSARHPEVRWLGPRAHAALPACYRAADVFVFPSRTDTYGLVMLEAMACGCPVAAYPVTGPIDVVGAGGVLDADLRAACLAALALDRAAVAHSARSRSWEATARQWLDALVPLLPMNSARRRQLRLDGGAEPGGFGFSLGTVGALVRGGPQAAGQVGDALGRALDAARATGNDAGAQRLGLGHEGRRGQIGNGHLG